MTKFSIIVPVYNCDMFLDNCIKSILAQSFNDFELILVDDGSTDDSLNICYKYKSLDKRINVIHKENGGVSSARNIGLLHAKGEYVTFIDSDDFISKDSLLKIFDIILNTNADIVKCSYFKVYGSIKREYKFSIDCNILINKNLYNEKIYPYIFDTFDLSNVWATFFKKNLLDNITFSRELSYAEDMKFLFDVINNSNSIYFLNMPLYNYCFNVSSAINDVNLDKLKKKISDNKFVFNYILKILDLNNIQYNSRFHNLLNEILMVINFKSFNDFSNFLSELSQNGVLNLEELHLYMNKRKYYFLKVLNIFNILKNKLKRIIGGFVK